MYPPLLLQLVVLHTQCYQLSALVLCWCLLLTLTVSLPLLPLLHPYHQPSITAQCIIAHLETADVQRLLRIYHYAQRYEADWEIAWLQAEAKEAEERKNEPSMADDDMMGASLRWRLVGWWLALCA